MKAIIISGTPGTGKTTLAKKLAKKLNCRCLGIGKLIKTNKLNEYYDRERQCWVVDVKKLNKELIKEIKKYKKVIIDSHLSHYLPKKYVNLCIITKCDLKILEKRLKKRKYPEAKIRENLECEIFDVCLNEAWEIGHNIFVINTTKGLNIDKVFPLIKSRLKNESPS